MDFGTSQGSVGAGAQGQGLGKGQGAFAAKEPVKEKALLCGLWGPGGVSGVAVFLLFTGCALWAQKKNTPAVIPLVARPVPGVHVYSMTGAVIHIEQSPWRGWGTAYVSGADIPR